MTTQAGRRGPALRDELLPLAVAAGGTVAGIAVGIARGAPNWPVYLLVIVIGIGVVATVHLRVALSRATLWGLVVFALGHVAGGMVPVGEGVLYQQWIVEPVLRYDNIQHAWGFGFVGRATWESLRRRLGPAATDPAVTVAVVILGAAAFGAVNEIVEWVLTLTIPGTDVGGYDNTARDLVANLVGGVLVAVATVRAPLRARTDVAGGQPERTDAQCPSGGRRRHRSSP